MGAQVIHYLVVLSRPLVSEGEKFLLVDGEQAGQKVAATGRHHANLLREVSLQTFKLLLCLLHCSLGLCMWVGVEGGEEGVREWSKLTF